MMDQAASQCRDPNEAARPSVASLIRAAQARLAPMGERGRLEAELLLADALGVERAWLYAHSPDPVAAAIAGRFRARVERRALGEPVAYILGRREFWSLDFEVGPAVLIPRPESELLVERALAVLPCEGRVDVLDLATGCGAIAIAIATERPGASLTATDLSADALEVAGSNADRLTPGRIAFVRGTWLEPVAGRRFHLITCNPPYVADHDAHLTRGDVRFEPRLALAAGADGLSEIRALTARLLKALHPGGHLLLEHGLDQGARVRQMLEDIGLSSIATYRDLSGHERVTEATRP